MKTMSQVDRIKKIEEEIVVLLSKVFTLKEENRRYTLFRAILIVTAFVLITLNWYTTDRKNNYVVNHPSERTYYALTTSKFEDREATIELRQKAASRIVNVMVQNEKVSSEVNYRLDRLIARQYNEVLTTKLVRLLDRLSSTKRDLIVNVAVKIGKEVKNEAQNLDEQNRLVWQKLSKTELRQSDKNIVFQLLNNVLNPSLCSDVEMTEKIRGDVAADIPPVVREIQVGSVLVQKGQVITPALAKLLEAQGYPDASFPIKQMVVVLLVIFVWSFWPIWIEKGLRDKLSEREWIYIAVVTAFVWMLETGFARLDIYSLAVIGLTGWLCLTLPISLSFHVIIGGGMIGAMIAYGATPWIIALGSVLSVFAACIGRVLFIYPPTHRMAIWKNLFGLGFCLCFIMLFMHWGLGLHINTRLVTGTLLFSAAWGAAVIALLPMWENLFDVISPLRLLELSHPSQPLIKRLQMEAPGTYHHSLMVGTLAESAADALKMNGLLVKAGAYYHDIGKLKNPMYFVENQIDKENLHDNLSPNLSALVLISHVKDGLEIAEDMKLPKTLRRFISEHHGTMVQKYFYNKAKLLEENVSEEQFRYPGPRPQSRETALVMMADSVEAASKARGKSFDSVKEIKLLVHDVIQQKIDAGQLDDIDFTFRELDVIKNCFQEILRTTYYSREVKKLTEFMKDKDTNNGENQTSKVTEKE